MEPRIKQLSEKKLVGHHLTMSLVDNKTGQLWGGFAPKIKTIPKRVSMDKISLQVYPTDYYQAFQPQREFVKWAAVEVEDFSEVPEGMATFVLPGGRYAVFDYRGSSADPAIFEYIFSGWLPASGYAVDDRPHFEVLGTRYRNNDPDSEEEIWIPVREK